MNKRAYIQGYIQKSGAAYGEGDEDLFSGGPDVFSDESANAPAARPPAARPPAARPPAKSRFNPVVGSGRWLSEAAPESGISSRGRASIRESAPTSGQTEAQFRATMARRGIGQDYIDHAARRAQTFAPATPPVAAATPATTPAAPGVVTQPQNSRMSNPIKVPYTTRTRLQPAVVDNNPSDIETDVYPGGKKIHIDLPSKVPMVGRSLSTDGRNYGVVSAQGQRQLARDLMDRANPKVADFLKGHRPTLPA